MKQGFVGRFVILFYLHSPCSVLVVYFQFSVLIYEESVRLCTWPPSILPKISHKIHFSPKPSLMHMPTFSSPPSQPFIPTETISTPTTFIKPIFSHHHISITLLTTFSINLTHPLVARRYAPLRRPYAPTETSKNCRSWRGTTAWTSWTNLGCSLGSHMTTFGTRESA